MGDALTTIDLIVLVIAGLLAVVIITMHSANSPEFLRFERMLAVVGVVVTTAWMVGIYSYIDDYGLGFLPWVGYLAVLPLAVRILITMRRYKHHRICSRCGEPRERVPEPPGTTCLECGSTRSCLPKSLMAGHDYKGSSGDERPFREWSQTTRRGLRTIVVVVSSVVAVTLTVAVITRISVTPETRAAVLSRMLWTLGAVGAALAAWVIRDRYPKLDQPPD